MSSKTRVAPNDLEIFFADSEAMDFPPKSGAVSQRSIYQKKKFNHKEHKGSQKFYPFTAPADNPWTILR